MRPLRLLAFWATLLLCGNPALAQSSKCPAGQFLNATGAYPPSACSTPTVAPSAIPLPNGNIIIGNSGAQGQAYALGAGVQTALVSGSINWAGNIITSGNLQVTGTMEGYSGGFLPVALLTGSFTDGDCMEYSATTNALADAGAGCASVTSVGLSVPGSSIFGTSGTNPITASGTIALTTAGTSGGVPYFSTAATLSSSAALATGALVVGGGAGSAPATTATGSGVVTALGINTGSAGAFVVNGGAGGTPSSITLTNGSNLPISGIVGLGTAAADNTGTSGATLGLLNANKTDSGTNNFTGPQTIGSGVPRCDITAYGASPSAGNNASSAWAQCINALALQSVGSFIGTIFVPQGDYCVGLVTASATASFSGTTMTVTNMSAGMFTINQSLTFAGQSGSPVVTAVPTIVGGVGTYTISVSQGTIAAETVTATTPAEIDLPPQLLLGVQGVGFGTGVVLNGNGQAGSPCTSYSSDATVLQVENHDVIRDITVYGYNTAGSTHSACLFLKGAAFAENLWCQYGKKPLDIEWDDVVLINPQASFGTGVANVYIRSAVTIFGGGADQQFPAGVSCSYVSEPSGWIASHTYAADACVSVDAGAYIMQTTGGGVSGSGSFPIVAYSYGTAYTDGGITDWKLVSPWPFASTQFDTVTTGSAGEGHITRFDMSGAYTNSFTMTNSLSGTPYGKLKLEDIIAGSGNATASLAAGSNVSITDSELLGTGGISAQSGFAGGLTIANNPVVGGPIIISGASTAGGYSIDGNVFNTGAANAITVSASITDVTATGNTMKGITGDCLSIATGADYIDFFGNNCHGATIANSSAGSHISATASNNY